MEQPTDRYIAEGIRSGDSGAESEFYRRFHPRVLFYLNKRLGYTAGAEDLAHDTVLIVLRKLRNEALDDPDSLAGYVLRTARNVYIAWVRKSERQKTQSVEDFSEIPSGAINDTVDSVLKSEAAEIVDVLLGELRQERDRQILRQHYLQGLSKAVVCENLDLLPDQFDKVIFNARKRFKTLVEARVAELEGLIDGV